MSKEQKNDEEIRKDIINVLSKEYKELYSNKEVFIDFLQNMMLASWSKDLKPENLELLDKSYVKSDYEGKESDIVYSANINNNEVIFYILLESDSTVDNSMPLRLFFYINEILQEYCKNTDNKKEHIYIKVPAIIPIVLYNGVQVWQAPINFRSITANGEIFKDYSFDFSYNIFDINHSYTKEQLIQKKCITSAIFMLDQKVGPVEFLNRIKDSVLFFNKLTDTELQILKHWIKISTEDRLTDIALKILDLNNKEEAVKMVAANIRILSEMEEKTREAGRAEGRIEGQEKGKNEGRIEGMLEGIAKGKEDGLLQGREEEKEVYRQQQAERAEKLLSKKFGDLTEEYKKKIKILDKEKLDIILDNILDIENLNDIKF